jgi:hypothetical protein
MHEGVPTPAQFLASVPLGKFATVFPTRIFDTEEDALRSITPGSNTSVYYKRESGSLWLLVSDMPGVVERRRMRR